MTPPARTPRQRKHDALDRLDRDTDAWVATASPANGAPHLVPLSFLWDGTTLLIATPSASWLVDISAAGTPAGAPGS